MIQEHYKKAVEALNEYKKRMIDIKDLWEKETEAEINLDSAMAYETDRLENSGISKTSLPQAVKGTQLVRDAKKALLEAKMNVKIKEASMKFCDMSYSLEKKMISSVESELKYIP